MYKKKIHDTQKADVSTSPTYNARSLMADIIISTHQIDYHRQVSRLYPLS